MQFRDWKKKACNCFRNCFAAINALQESANFHAAETTVSNDTVINDRWIRQEVVERESAWKLSACCTDDGENPRIFYLAFSLTIINIKFDMQVDRMKINFSKLLQTWQGRNSSSLHVLSINKFSANNKIICNTQLWSTVKLSPHLPWRCLDGDDVYLLLLLEFGTPRPRFTLGEGASGADWVGGWVGPRACLDAEARRKILCPCRDGTRVVHFVVNTPCWLNYSDSLCTLVSRKTYSGST
jgi:hypothetical protein